MTKMALYRTDDSNVVHEDCGCRENIALQLAKMVSGVTES
jgi:hypothetical protein